MTLGLVLDGSGFVRRSEVFEGNADEGKTLAQMLRDLEAPVGALVVMDAGIASEANLTWLREQGYHYLVVSRERAAHSKLKQRFRLKPPPVTASRFSASTIPHSRRYGSIVTPSSENTKSRPSISASTNASRRGYRKSQTAC